MSPVPWLKRVLPACLALCWTLPLQAGITVDLGSIDGGTWRADAVELQLGDAPERGYRLSGRIARLALPGQGGELRDLRFSCETLWVEEDAYQCPRLRLQAETPYGTQTLQGALHYQDAAHWSFSLQGLQLADGDWTLSGKADGDWQLSWHGERVALARLIELFGVSGLPPWGWQGRLELNGQLAGSALQPARLNLEARIAHGAWSDADGLQAAQDLKGSVRLQAEQAGTAWQLRITSGWQGGQVYSDPTFVELSQHPLRLSGRLRWSGADQPLAVNALEVHLGNLLQLTGQGRVPVAEPLQGSVQLRAELPDLKAAYPVLLQPFGYGRAFGELDIDGAARAQLDWRQGAPAGAELHLAEVHLDDRGGRFGLSDLTADLNWQSSGQAQPSRLRWQGGHLYRIVFGASEAGLLLGADRLTLARPLVLPILEGELRIPELDARGLLGGEPTWRAALRASKLSLPALTDALGWPALAGQLSVQIPAVHYAEGVLAMDGELLAEAFDGQVAVSGLQLRDPAGPAPVFEAQARLRGLDLERLTQVFDFGRITGRLDGEVRGLQLVGWQPTAFEAELRNPADDDLPHKISQRAVENLTALGNNGAVALSGTLLRFFESFSYDRMLLKVRLSGQRAELDGIPHPSGGYYLVKGAGLPRIDVIGRNREVAWRDLVERLRRIHLEGAQVR